MDRQPTLVGRESERAVLRAAVEAAVAGDPGMVLVHGEAGIGKTSLVREAALSASTAGVHVLVGQCLRFGSDVTSYVPFTQAITRWLRTTDSDGRDRLAPGGRLEDVVPALIDEGRGIALLQIGAFLDALQADRPTVLVVDDLQWSDPSSLDALSYLVAGFVAGQRLAILATYRDTDLADGHRLYGWLADACRMPAVSQFGLDRMDLWTVQGLVLARGGLQTQPRLAEEVHRRSGGNPYLADLLIDDARLGGGGRFQPGGHLTDALSASWHRLSQLGRTVTQLLAMAGAPTAFPVLRELASQRGLTPESAATAVAEAAAGGITVETESGAIWFRHPLLVETIAATLKNWEVADLHQGLAAIWLGAQDVDERDRANALSLHYVAAGDHDQAFTWSVRAAGEAAAIRAWEEQASHLSTAAGLLDQVSDAVTRQCDAVDLLTRAGRAHEAAGDDLGAVRHYEAALARVDRRVDPLLASRILLELHILRDLAGLGTTALSLSEPREVLALTEGAPDSEERALAFAHLAFAEAFTGLDDAREHAAAAVRVAESVGTVKALVWSYGTRAQTRWGTEDGIADARRAFELAATADDAQLLCRSAFFLSNSYESAGQYPAAAETTVHAYRMLIDVGQFDFAAAVGAVGARWCFTLGRWNEVRQMVRELLTMARSDNSSGISRCLAALLTAHEGNREAAALHLRRAEELMPTAAPVGDPLVDTQIRMAIVLGDPLYALALISSHMAEAVQVNPIAGDEWLELASRAVVELDELPSKDAVHDTARRQLLLIEATRGQEPQSFVPAGPRDVVHPALGALHAAQRAQCLGPAESVAELWEVACEATQRADMQFEHARALYRLARHLLTHREDRKRASAALVSARGIAVSLGAGPLTASIDQLAVQTHLSLPSAVPQASAEPAPVLPGRQPLTARERDVLEGVVAGETYGQIAARLFISDKTVSSHVSNILRKTGTTNRIELAALAMTPAVARPAGRP